MSRIARLLALPFAFLMAACSACAPAQPAKTIGPSWEDQYTHHTPDVRVNTIVGTYYLDKRFSDQRKDQIKLACEHWNVVFNGRIKFNYARDVDFTDPINTELFEAMHEQSDAIPLFFVWEDATDLFQPAGALAYVESSDMHVVHLIDSRLNFTFYPEVVVMHEIGHTLGLEHSDAANTLMSRSYDQQPHCIDEVTVRTLAGQWHHDPYTFNWCPVP